MKTDSCSRKRTKSRAAAASAFVPPSKKAKIQRNDNSGTKTPNVTPKKCTPSSRQVRLPSLPTKNRRLYPSSIGPRKEKEEPHRPIEPQENAGTPSIEPNLGCQVESQIEVPDDGVCREDKQDITLTTDLIDASNILALFKLGKTPIIPPAFQSDKATLENPPSDDDGNDSASGRQRRVMTTLKERDATDFYKNKPTEEKSTNKCLPHEVSECNSYAVSESPNPVDKPLSHVRDHHALIGNSLEMSNVCSPLAKSPLAKSTNDGRVSCSCWFSKELKTRDGSYFESPTKEKSTIKGETNEVGGSYSVWDCWFCTHLSKQDASYFDSSPIKEKSIVKSQPQEVEASKPPDLPMYYGWDDSTGLYPWVIKEFKERDPTYFDDTPPR